MLIETLQGKRLFKELRQKCEDNTKAGEIQCSEIDSISLEYQLMTAFCASFIKQR
jgi:hypothetical protein